MTDPNKNNAAVVEARKKVKAHPMCFKLQDVGGAYVVVYPDGDFRYGGARAVYRRLGGKLAALNYLLDVMETEWKLSYPSATRT